MCRGAEQDLVVIATEVWLEYMSVETVYECLGHGDLFCHLDLER